MSALNSSVLVVMDLLMVEQVLVGKILPEEH